MGLTLNFNAGVTGGVTAMIAQAIKILRAGGLVAFATETVYGLGADASNSAAVEKIFAAKGRPSTNPLIVHVADERVARRYARSWSAQASRLARQFWPGPLTLILPRMDSIVGEVTAGRDTVGLRVPNHALALELLRAFDGPIAAPSANRANHISPTSAADVRAELGTAVDFILDGGPCLVGIESTVLDLTGDHPSILRPGQVTRKQIEAVIGPVDVFTGAIDAAVSAASPGQHARHYSPVTPTFRYEFSERNTMLTRHAADASSCIVTVGPAGLNESDSRLIQMPANPELYARNLYKVLRQQDLLGLQTIFIEMPPDEPQWSAVRDRLCRASKAVS